MVQVLQKNTTKKEKRKTGFDLPGQISHCVWGGVNMKEWREAMRRKGTGWEEITGRVLERS